MSKKSENVRNLYLEAIRDGNIEVVKNYTGDRYTQHSTGVKDGTDGFIEFFSDFLKRTSKRDIRLIRVIEDGRYVFAHAYQDIDNGSAKWVTTDLFDTDNNDKIIEHWDVISAYTEVKDSVSGNDVILGEFEIKDLHKTEENKALVRSFIVDVFQNGNHENVDRYISTQKYVQHNPNHPNGIEGVKDTLATEDFNYDFVFKVIGEGNYVVSYSKVIYNQQEWAVFDIFRIENGKIVEHWDNMESIPPRSEWANTGKF